MGAKSIKKRAVWAWEGIKRRRSFQGPHALRVAGGSGSLKYRRRAGGGLHKMKPRAYQYTESMGDSMLVKMRGSRGGRAGDMVPARALSMAKRDRKGRATYRGHSI